MSWHAAQALPHYELAVMIDHLLDAENGWSHTDENLAALVDALSYWLGSEYMGWVTDPDDPEVKAARAARKRNPVKPPPVPIIPPVAQRPPHAQAAALQRLRALREAYQPSPAPKPGESPIAALDALLGGI